MGGPEAHQMEELTSWADGDLKGVKYYSGTATYTREFTIEEHLRTKEKEVYVAFEDIQEIVNVSVNVSVNGKDCGVIWTPPYEVNIT